MHISNFKQCFYSKRGYGSYGSLWKVQNIWGEFFPPLSSHQLVFITSATGTVSVSNFAPGSAFISWGGSVMIKIKILERSYLTEVSDVRSELPVWSQWEEQVHVHKASLSYNPHVQIHESTFLQMSGEVFVTFLHTSQAQKCFYPRTATAHNPEQITWPSEARI